MRDILEQIVAHPQGIDAATLAEIQRYTKLFWINTGPYKQPVGVEGKKGARDTPCEERGKLRTPSVRSPSCLDRCAASNEDFVLVGVPHSGPGARSAPKDQAN